MFHLVSYNQSQDAAGAFVRVSGSGGEDAVTVSGNDVTVPAALPYIVAIGVVGDATTAQQAKIISPSLKKRGHDEFVSPLENGLVFSNPPLISDYRYHPIPLEIGEALGVELLNNPAAAVQSYVGVWLADQALMPYVGAVQTIRATTAITQVVTNWVRGAFTFATSLKAGTYWVVGAKCVAANGVFARLNFPGGAWRPGLPVSTTSTTQDNAMFRRGGMGIWGEFKHNSPPTGEILGVTNTAQEWLLDLVYVRA